MIVRVAVPEEHVGPATLEPALEATTRVNQHMIQAGQLPLLDDVLAAGAVRWEPEPPGYESFDHGGIVLARKNGDCDDLASWHAASLRQTKEDPGARAVVVRTGPTLWHAVVERSDGAIDDPSEWAGMPSASRYTPPTHAPMVNGRCYVGIWQHGPMWRARLDVPVGVAGCCDHKAEKCCACSVTYDAADPRLAIAHAAQGAHVLGGHAGAASDDLAKLQALAALSRGISQRKLIDHVDPDLLLCAVLLNQTLERKLQAIAPHLLRRPLEPAHFDIAPTMADTGPPASYAMQGRGWPGRRWPVDLRGRDFGGAMASFSRVNRPHDDPLSVGADLTWAQALDVAKSFQHGMAHYWSSPDGQALAQANAVVASHGLAKLGITGAKIVAFWRDHQELSIPQAAHALYVAARFQHGMAQYWSALPKQFWLSSPPQVRAAIYAVSKKLKMPVGAIVQQLASQRDYSGPSPRPWTPADLVSFAQSAHDEHGNPSPESLPDAIAVLMPDFSDPLYGFPSVKELAASEHAAAMVKQKMIESLGGSRPPDEVITAGENNARAQTFLQVATDRMRKAGKKTSPLFEYWASVAEDAGNAFDDAWEALRAAQLEAGTGLTTSDAAAMASKVVQIVAMVIMSII